MHKHLRLKGLARETTKTLEAMGSKSGSTMSMRHSEGMQRPTLLQQTCRSTTWLPRRRRNRGRESISDPSTVSLASTIPKRLIILVAASTQQLRGKICISHLTREKAYQTPFQASSSTHSLPS